MYPVEGNMYQNFGEISEQLPGIFVDFSIHHLRCPIVHVFLGALIQHIVTVLDIFTTLLNESLKELYVLK